MKQVILLGLILLISACSVPDGSTPIPTPQAISIYYPAALKPWADKFSGCAENKSLISLFFTQSNQQVADVSSGEIVLLLGEPVSKPNSSYLTQVGIENIVVLVNKDNQLTQLSSEQLQSIFTGRSLNLGNGFVQSTQVWIFPKNDPLREAFDSALLSAQNVAGNAMLAPDPDAMLEAISSDDSSIGYIPQSFITAKGSSAVDKVKSIQLDASLEQKLSLPVIAVTKNEPGGLARELLVCVQSQTH